MSHTYRNGFHKGNGNYGPEFYRTESKPVHIGKYLRYRNPAGSYDFVYDGVCFAQRVGATDEAGIDGCRYAQSNLLDICGVKFGPTWADEAA